MGKLEDEVKRDFVGMGKRLKKITEGGLNLDGLDLEEGFARIQSRIDGVENAVIRLARHIDRVG